MDLISKIKIGLGLALIAAALGLWLHGRAVALERDRLAGERDQLSGQLAASRLHAESLSWELAGQRRALADREAEKARLAEEMDHLTDELEKLYAQDCEAAAWADAPLPDAVLERLRGQ